MKLQRSPREAQATRMKARTTNSRTRRWYAVRMTRVLACALALAACSPAPPPKRATRVDPPPPVRAVEDAAVIEDAGAPEAEAAAPEPVYGDDPMELHKTTKEELLAFFDKREQYPEIPIGPLHNMISQGNKAIANHTISKKKCMEGLKGIVLQTPEQKARCGGHENMVPIYEKGDPSTAKFCIDIFEFPNKTCELPLVWVRVFDAKKICEAMGKRLCDQGEWNMACRADPEGGPDRVYAYGDDLDLTICNSNKSRAGRNKCAFGSVQEMFMTCPTDTEPSGAFPRCRSRFGVFDQHGNLAEIMSRVHYDGKTYSQLKGSASFYVDVARKPNESTGGWLRYPDHCNFDPRWHVEEIKTAAHYNYHLGFRCCRDLPR
jgi:hypothetical protein